MLYVCETAMGFSLFVYLVYLFFTTYFKNPVKHVVYTDKSYPKVSILKPLKYIDNDFEDNLLSFITLDYPDYEILLGMDNCSIETIDKLKLICSKYPNNIVKLIAKKGFSRSNPKIETLSVLESYASGSLYWVSDSNTRVGKDTLKMLVNEYLTNKSKLIYSPIFGTGSKTAASVMENSYLNLFVSGSILTGNITAKQHIIVGKSMLIERNALEKFGGFSYFGKYLAEDFMIGKEFLERGMSVSSNFTWITNYVSNSSIPSFAARMARWAKLRFHLNPLIYCLEILTNPIGLGLISIMMLGKEALPAALCTACAKILIEYASMLIMNPADARKLWILLSFPFVILFRDAILFFYVYFIPFISYTVSWGNRTMTIGKYSIINEARA